ncbi:MAG: type III secretion inner membrane ring lipoprotein SctJ [Pseudomonadota bacterium]
MMRFPRWLAACCLVLTLAGCKVELYSGLSEHEANEMVALLLANGISAEKGASDGGVVSLMVEDADLPTAVEMLRQYGYPRDSFNDLGTVFAQEGLISSPLQERVRFIYGLSQTVSETLSQIDGVITARVHLVVPDQHPLDNEPGKPSASVFLKTRPGLNLEDRLPQVKMLVQASVEGLAYDDVVVMMFEAEPPSALSEIAREKPTVEYFGVEFAADSMDSLTLIVVGAGVLLLLAVSGNVYFILRSRQRAKSDVPAVVK